MQEQSVQTAINQAMQQRVDEYAADAADENHVSDNSEQLIEQYNNYQFITRVTAARTNMRDNTRRTKILVGRDKIYTLLSRVQVQPVSL